MKTFELSIVFDDEGRSFRKNVSITAADRDELSEKLDLMTTLSEAVKHDDLCVTVELIKEKPGLIPVIKEMIKEGENLSETQLMLRLPKYVSKVVKVLKS